MACRVHSISSFVTGGMECGEFDDSLVGFKRQKVLNGFEMIRRVSVQVQSLREVRSAEFSKSSS